ncbi:MAG: uracil-DNA glycosylase family protein [bacterium]|nr:uracil-DNA glycosylase family protein [bacterium]
MPNQKPFDPTQHPAVHAIDAAIEAVTQLRESGVKTLHVDKDLWSTFCTPVKVVKPTITSIKSIPTASTITRPADKVSSQPPNEEVLKATISVLNKEITACQMCSLANASRCASQGVRLAPKVMVINGAYMLGNRPEAIGSRLEGPAGEMLWKMLESIQLSPHDVYLTHAIRCPVQGRPPRDAMLRCSEWLKREIRTLSPKAILFLGPYAGSTLFPNASAASLAIGKWLLFEGIPCLSIHHPMRLQLLDEAIARPMKMENWTALKALRQRMN